MPAVRGISEWDRIRCLWENLLLPYPARRGETQNHRPVFNFIHLDELFGKISNFTDVGLNQKNEYDIKATPQKTKITEWQKLKTVRVRHSWIDPQ